ncbi:unnamed protein product [Mytilus edulis]|uniref:MAM domain-containing protein n=1 Tax=Mytilus edulis TaxID=6550 RepID=A0A8S3Q6P6_MYTED|nr:unnamed protein product [Mytilus edulis]
MKRYRSNTLLSKPVSVKCYVSVPTEKETKPEFEATAKYHYGSDLAIDDIALTREFWYSMPGRTSNIKVEIETSWGQVKTIWSKNKIVKAGKWNKQALVINYYDNFQDIKTPSKQTTVQQTHFSTTSTHTEKSSPSASYSTTSKHVTKKKTTTDAKKTTLNKHDSKTTDHSTTPYIIQVTKKTFTTKKNKATKSEAEKSDHISKGAQAGIGITVALLGVGLVVAVLFIMKKKISTIDQGIKLNKNEIQLESKYTRTETYINGDTKCVIENGISQANNQTAWTSTEPLCKHICLLEVFSERTKATIDCNFDNDLCEWRNKADSCFNWTIGNGKTGDKTSGPIADHTTGSPPSLQRTTTTLSPTTIQIAALPINCNFEDGLCGFRTDNSEGQKIKSTTRAATSTRPTLKTSPAIVFNKTSSCPSEYFGLLSALSCDFTSDFCNYTTVDSPVHWQRKKGASGRTWVAKIPERINTLSGT